MAKKPNPAAIKEKLLTGTPNLVRSVLAYEANGFTLLLQKPVNYAAGVNVVSADRIGWVVRNRDGALTAACARARNIEGGDSSALSAQEAVVNSARVNVLSSNRPPPY
jgi:hypothetical protein